MTSAPGHRIQAAGTKAGRWVFVAAIAGAATTAASVSLVASGLGLPPVMAWLVDLAVHWQLLYITVATGAALLHTLMRPTTSWFTWACVLVCALCVQQAGPGALRASDGPPSGETLSIATANVFYGNGLDAPRAVAGRGVAGHRSPAGACAGWSPPGRSLVRLSVSTRYGRRASLWRCSAVAASVCVDRRH